MWDHRLVDHGELLPGVPAESFSRAHDGAEGCLDVWFFAGSHKIDEVEGLGKSRRDRRAYRPVTRQLIETNASNAVDSCKRLRNPGDVLLDPPIARSMFVR